MTALSNLGLGQSCHSLFLLKNECQFDNLKLMPKKIRISRIEEIEALDFEYWLKAPPAKKLDTLQYLREMVYDLKHESRKRFQRILKVTRRQKS